MGRLWNFRKKITDAANRVEHVKALENNDGISIRQNMKINRTADDCGETLQCNGPGSSLQNHCMALEVLESSYGSALFNVILVDVNHARVGHIVRRTSPFLWVQARGWISRSHAVNCFGENFTNGSHGDTGADTRHGHRSTGRFLSFLGILSLRSFFDFNHYDSSEAFLAVYSWMAIGTWYTFL